MNFLDTAIAETFKNRIPSDIRPHVKRIIVFGSRARGTAAEDSDLDVAVLLERMDPDFHRRLSDTAYDVMWEHDFKPVISLKIFRENKFNEAVARGFSFYVHAQKEGILI